MMYVAFVTLTANLLGLYTTYRFMKTFFDVKDESVNRKREVLSYLGFYIIISAGHILIHNRTVNVITHMIGLYLIAGCYERKCLKKILVALLIYGINIGADFMTIYMFSDYHETKIIDESLSYVVVLIVAIIEIIYEKFFSKTKEKRICPISIC